VLKALHQFHYNKLRKADYPYNNKADVVINNAIDINKGARIEGQKDFLIREENGWIYRGDFARTTER
jgi:hypothetical protein